MNIHEYQAKKLLKKFGAPVPNGVHGTTTEEILNKTKLLNTEKYVLKAQIHSGGRGKAGGIKITNSLDELRQAADQILGKTLVTNQTGPEGKKVKKLYVEESSTIDKEFYLSCLVDRAKSKIAFISCLEGGMDIEEIAIKKPEKIITTRIDVEKEISEISGVVNDRLKILSDHYQGIDKEKFHEFMNRILYLQGKKHYSIFSKPTEIYKTSHII